MYIYSNKKNDEITKKSSNHQVSGVSAHSKATPAKLMRGLLAASESPAGWKVYPGTPATSKDTKQQSHQKDTSKVIEETKPTISPKAIRALRYDSNADDMASYYYHAASPVSDQMTSRDRDIFIFWYYEQVNNNYVWNHRRETYEYCKSDVDTFLF